MITNLPVNATTLFRAQQIADQAAREQVPVGTMMSIGRCVSYETVARPFRQVALEEAGADRDELHTFIFEATITRLQAGS